MPLVFVYGTLRKGEHHHDLLQNEKRLFAQAYVKGHLYDTNYYYPGFAIGEGVVYGEIYEVSGTTLQELDRLEGYNEKNEKDSLYIREMITAQTDTGQVSCYIYRLQHVEPSYRLIERGDWKEYRHFIEKPPVTYYFAYGSCMDTNRFRQHQVDHHFQKVIGAGKLKNYSLRFTVHAADGGRADIVEDGGTVEGIIYEVPFEAVRYLYKREGVNCSLYRPTFVDVEIDGQTYEDCLTFVVCKKKEELAPPDHYREEILRGSKGRVSNAYYEKIERYMKELPKQ
ncbi:gamma-glutamylcyclotransferase [Bacillus sp. FJAT-47783]|uniref:gamma-glutamylcyclotransferase n=1 Tax=Bacillus sp. FJAT-47783 TaxID=2922712 RepID=UPI001FABD54D|nr:gamma-glutamylcyclotransferase [Bacillus sp. FJAT-47783]